MSELTTLFKNTADAIRSKTGDTATMQASQFPAKIQGISVGISQDEADARYLQLSGGTMAGDLKVQESPESDASAVSKSYAQGLAASAISTANAAKSTAEAALPKSGGTMTGDLILNGAPTVDNQAATKAYVDSKSGGLSLVYSEDTPLSRSLNFNIQPNISNNKPFIVECVWKNGNTIYSSGSAYYNLCVVTKNIRLFSTETLPSNFTASSDIKSAKMFIPFGTNITASFSVEDIWQVPGDSTNLKFIHNNYIIPIIGGIYGSGGNVAGSITINVYQ